MNSKIINDLIKKYNIAEQDIFLILVKKALLGEIKQDDLGYNFYKALKMDMNSGAELAVELLFLQDKEKSQILKELNEVIRQQVDIDAEIRSVLYQVKVYVGENLDSRFKNQFLSWLKGIRDNVGLKESLMKAEKIGGLGLTDEQAEAVVVAFMAKKEEWQKNNINIQQILADYEKQQTQNVQPTGEVEEVNIDVAAKFSPTAFGQDKPVTAEKTIDSLLKEKSLPYNELAQKEAYKRQLEQKQTASPAMKNPVVEEIEEEEQFLESKEELAAPKSVSAPRPSSPQIRPVNVQPPQGATLPKPISPEIKPVDLPRPQIDIYNLPSQQPQAEFKQPMIKKTMPDSRPRLEDVKFTAQLYSPVEELGYLKIEDFRRLAKDPQEAAKKLMAKIELMESESYTKKAEGIAALKKSPLYKLYSEIMSQAIKEGKSIEQILTENPVISLAEFKAIMDLNKSLKY